MKHQWYQKVAIARLIGFIFAVIMSVLLLELGLLNINVPIKMDKINPRYLFDALWNQISTNSSLNHYLTNDFIYKIKTGFIEEYSLVGDKIDRWDIDESQKDQIEFK